MSTTLTNPVVEEELRAREQRVCKKERRRAQRHGNQLIRDNSPFPLSTFICPTTADSRCYATAQHLTRIITSDELVLFD